jgi:hypothetical protein
MELELAVKCPNIDRGNLDDVCFKSNVLIGQCMSMNQSQLLLPLTFRNYRAQVI